MNAKSSKMIKWLMFLFVLLAVTMAIMAVVWWQQSLMPVDENDDNPVVVVVPDGSGAATISRILKESELIRSDIRFRLYIKQQGWDKDLKPGRYQFLRSQSTPEIATVLNEGVVDDFWVTIPEGKRREEIAKILADAYAENGVSFSIPDFLQATENKEGYLFPDSYLIPKTWTVEDMVSILEQTFDDKLSNDLGQKANAVGLNPDEVIILASLVEREAKFDEDRAMIAGVMHNRLGIDMALQIDATVQYPLGTARCSNRIGQECDWWPVIASTKFDSEYNTYQYPGLPPAPIANPGLAVIEAVLDPANHDYLYYLSEDDGTTHYSETVEEHNAKVEKYLW